MSTRIIEERMLRQGPTHPPALGGDENDLQKSSARYIDISYTTRQLTMPNH
jgi:hypothetical protein